MECMDLTIGRDSRSSIRLVTVYRPTRSKKNRATTATFFEEFSLLLETVNLAPGYLLINGDFNFHMDVSDDTNASAFHDLLDSAGLKQHVTFPTHRCGHTLDLIIDRQVDSVLSAFSARSDLPSDHYAVLCTVAFTRPRATKSQVVFRKFRDIDMEAWREDILDSDLHKPAVTLSNVNLLADQYNAVLAELIDKHAPECSRSITLRPNAPWFDDTLKAMKKHKRKLERTYLKTRLEVHRQIYRDQCRIYTDALNYTKSSYYKAQISKADSNQLFRMIDSLVKVKRMPLLPSHASGQHLAQCFSDFFQSKIQKLRDNLQSSSATSKDTSVIINSSPCLSSFSEFTEVSENYIRELIEKSKPKSCCLDPLPTRVLKQSIDVLAYPITNIINTSLKTGVFPTSFKKGSVQPLIKKQTMDREDLSSYRPITNIAFLSKTMERVAATQTINYLTENNLLAKLQSAYRKFHSTETALLRVCNDILLAIDRGQEVVLVLLDLSSAFDTIDHKALLDRLHTRYGISGTVLDWFKSYLVNRTQSVKIGNNSSAENKILYGVPQGSVLGPLLFSLFFAPVEDVILAHGLDCMMYADDSQLYIAINPRSDRSAWLSKIELCIRDFFIWCTNNGLTCSLGKTEVAHFRSCHTRTFVPINNITIGDAVISPMPVVRDLGVLMDQHLLLRNQVNNMCKSAWYIIQRIGRIRPYLTQDVCERLVHAFITSKLDTCNSILYGLPTSELDKLQRVQNAAARLVSRTPKSDHITPVLKKLHWLPVKDRIVFKLLLLTFKALHGQAPIYISELLKPYNPSRSLRSSTLNYLSVQKTKTVTYGDRSFSVAAAQLWNALPNHFRQIHNLSTFKSSLKTWLFSYTFN